MSRLPARVRRQLHAQRRKLERVAGILACVSRLIANGRDVDVIAPTNLCSRLVAAAADKLDAIARKTE
jgi:hypothetical protein